MVIPEFIITCWVLVPLGNFLRHISVRSVLTSVYSVSNCIFRVYSVGSVGNTIDPIPIAGFFKGDR